MTPPAARLHLLLRPWLTATVAADVLDPAVADLQFEAAHARTARARTAAILRGYLAIARALLLSFHPAGATRVTLALGAVCAMGTLLVTDARTAGAEARVLNSAILAPGMLAPLVLRMLGTTSSRRLFVGSLTVAMLTAAVTGAVGMNDGGGLMVRLAHALAVLLAFAPLAAAAAIVAAPDRTTRPTRAVTAVSLGRGVATLSILLARVPQGAPLSIGLALTPFYLVLFALLFALTLLPALLVARVFIARPASLIVTALVCAPAPLVAGAHIDHITLAMLFDALRETPFSFAAWSLPFVLGAVAVGGSLPARRSKDEPMLAAIGTRH
jgi:hypothetical protein